MFNYIKYKLFERRLLRELEHSPAGNLMRMFGVNERMFKDVLEKHALNLPIDTMQALGLSERVSNLYGRTDAHTLAILYTTFLWTYAFCYGKTLRMDQDEDEHRHARIEFGLKKFAVIEKRGFLFLAPLEKNDYDEYHKQYNRPVFATGGNLLKYAKKFLFLIGVIVAIVIGWTATDSLLERAPGLSEDSPTDTLIKSTDDSVLNWPDEYKIEAIQLGGQGVRQKQLTAYLTTGHGYLHPVEEYASTYFNNGGDIMYVSCADGYVATECEGGVKAFITDSDNSCGIQIADVPKTRATVLCVKQ